MAIKRVEPDEAARLMNDGWTYLDVRSVPEFEQGHPTGAFNIPLLDMVPGQGLKPNPSFLVEVKNTFAPDTQLVIGCKSGGRSLKAAQMLAESGYTNVVDMRGGFGGEMDAGGGVACAGWHARSLPTSTKAESGRSYQDLKAPK